MRLVSFKTFFSSIFGLALAVMLLVRPDLWGSMASGGLAFFFFFYNPSNAFVPRSWVVGRLMAKDTPVLIALAPGNTVVRLGWHRVVTVIGGPDEVWTLMVSKASGVGLTRATQLVDASEDHVDGVPLTNVVLQALRVDEANPPTALQVDEVNLRALFRVAVISDVSEQASDRPRWVKDVIDDHKHSAGTRQTGEERHTSDEPAGHTDNKPHTKPRFALETSLGKMSLAPYHARERTVLAVGFTDGDRTELPADLVAVLCHANARDFLPEVLEVEEVTRERETAVLDALVAVGRVSKDDRQAFVQSLEEQRKRLQSIETTARESATMVRSLRQAAVSRAEDERLQSITRSLHAAADDFRTQSRGLVQLAAPLAAEWRGRKDYEEAEAARTRSDRVVLFATMVATLIGIPALVAGFFGAAVTPLTSESPVRFSDLFVAAICVSLASLAFAEAVLHRPERLPWPCALALRLIPYFLAPALAWAWLYCFDGFADVLGGRTPLLTVGAVAIVAALSLLLATLFDRKEQLLMASTKP